MASRRSSVAKSKNKTFFEPPLNPADIRTKIPPRSGYYTFQMNEGYNIVMYLKSTDFEPISSDMSYRYRVVLDKACMGCKRKVYLDQMYCECGDGIMGATVQYAHEACL